MLFLLLVLVGAPLSAESACSENGTDELYNVDLTHAEYTNYTCGDTAVRSLCFRNCSQSRLVAYSGIKPIRSPTYNGTKWSYDLKKLNLVYAAGKAFMKGCEREEFFDLIKQIKTNKWLASPIDKNNVLKIVEAELPWFMVIMFFILIVVFLSIFVTFSMLDGVFGWTDSTKRQKMDPSNETWVNINGFLIIMVTVIVLIGCLLCFVGNLLVTENKAQAKKQLEANYDWSMSYALQGTVQLGELISEFEDQLLTEIQVLFNDSIQAGVDKVWAGTKDNVDTMLSTAVSLDANLKKAVGLEAFATKINLSMAIINETNVTGNVCLTTIPVLMAEYCDSKGETDLDKCFEDTKGKNKFTKPDLAFINVTWPNTTLINYESLVNSSNAIKAAYDAKILSDVQQGNTRWNNLKKTLLQRTKSNRTAYALMLAQTKIVSSSQLTAFISQLNIGFRSFTKAIQFPNFFFSNNSPLSDTNDIRYVIFIFVNVLCVATIVVGVFAWCVGCCNFNAKQIPMSRGPKSHIPGVILYYSSYAALFLSLFTISCGVVYFIPTSLFSFSCTVYDDADKVMKKVNPSCTEAEKNFFMFWDDHLFVDDNILGRYIHNDGNFNLLFEDFFKSCYKDDTLYTALKLNQKWDLATILALNETLNIAYHITELKKADYSDQLLMTASKATYCNNLGDTLKELEFTVISTILSSTTMLFSGKSQDEVNAWVTNIDEWHKKMKKEVDTDGEEYINFSDNCLDRITDGDETLDSLIGVNQDKKDKDKKRKKRFFDWDAINDAAKNADKTTDMTKKGWGAYNKKYLEYMDNFDTTYQLINNAIDESESKSEALYIAYLAAEPKFLTVQGPIWLDGVIDEYEEYIYEEMDCFVITAAKQIQYMMGQCRTVYDVLDGTMLYFCNFLVGPMTITWMSFLMIGIGLTVYIQVARAVSMYFLKMDEIHPDDISQEDKIKAMAG